MNRKTKYQRIVWTDVYVFLSGFKRSNIPYIYFGSQFLKSFLDDSAIFFVFRLLKNRPALFSCRIISLPLFFNYSYQVIKLSIFSRSVLMPLSGCSQSGYPIAIPTTICLDSGRFNAFLTASGSCSYRS